MNKYRKLIIFGTGDHAEIACEYFMHDSHYEVVAFTVDRQYMDGDSFYGLPLVAFDEVKEKYPPDTYEMHVALIYTNLNKLRETVCSKAKSLGYRLASYISSSAFVWHNVKIGENAFIFEDNTIQPFVEIGNNVILWSGNHVGHSSKIGDNVFVSSHVVISGWCNIGSNSFLGVNSTLANNTKVGKECWVQHGAVLAGEIPDNSMVKTKISEVVPLNVDALNRSLKRASEKRK